MTNEDSKLTNFFRKIGNTILLSKKTPEKLRNAGRKLKNPSEPRKQIPSFLKNFMDRRNAGWPEYVILKTQAAVVALFASSVLIASSWVPSLVVTPALGALVIYLVYLTLTELKIAFDRDYSAYRTFVGLSIGISLTIVFLNKILIMGYIFIPETPYSAFFPIFLIISVTIGTITFFRVKYGRDYTFGVVKETKNNKAVVKIGYDIKSNVKNGLYLLESLPDVQPGDEVKVSVDRPVLGLKGSEPITILDKAQPAVSN